MEIAESIIIKEGGKAGKTVAVFAGIHGNEKAGIEAMKKVLDDVEITSGKVYFVFANPEAIEKNVRYVEKNLNRCFIKGNVGTTLEDQRAVELSKIMDECEMLLDLHASNNPRSTPFIVCEENGYDVAKIFDFSIIVVGFDEFEPGGSDGYMLQNGKIGIGLECGSVLDGEEGALIAEKSIYQFLKYAGNILSDVEYSKDKKKKMKLVRIGKKKTEDFFFENTYEDFEMLKEGEIFAIDGSEKYIAGKNEYIIFPNPKKKIGEEVFLIAKTF